MKFHITVALILLLLPSCAFSPGKTRHMLNKSSREQFDAIIVPGVPFKGEKWDLIMKSRVYWSKYLYEKNIARNIIYSGGAVYTPYIEGQIMAMYAEKIGIPKEHIFIEKRAQHSTENAVYAFRLAKSLGFRKIAFASDPFQTKMLQSFVRKKLKNEITLIPFVFDTLRAMKPMMTDPEIDYQKAYTQDFVSILRRENFSQRFRGTLGLRIDTTVYSEH